MSLKHIITGILLFGLFSSSVKSQSRSSFHSGIYHSPGMKIICENDTCVSDKVVENRRIFGLPTKEEFCPSSINSYVQWGYVDSNAFLVIPPIYDEVSNFKNGLAVVGKCFHEEERFYRWHILPDGERLYEKNYVDVTSFHGAYAIADIDGNFHKCHINKKGERIYSQTYIELDIFNENGKTLALKKVNLMTHKGLWVVIDTKGNELASGWGNYGYKNEPPKSLDVYLNKK